MDIKKIVKRNIKEAFELALGKTLDIALIPVTLGFTHTSYLYFYITNPNGSDEELSLFLNNQLNDFLAAENRVLAKIDKKLGIDREEVNHG